ncbi:MAG: 3-hydroxyacyl-CoA dehydrogenase NAD-binding domain-containing protein [Bryobacteraceae bacterium]
MDGLVCFEIRGDVAVITMNNPPVNALTTGVPQGVAEAVERACNDAAVRAIVVIGGGRTFAAGADINEFVRYAAGQGPWPVFHRWLNGIEDATKPVVMAIHGQAFGAGLELAMAGHYRVIATDAQVGQPEVKIGLIPGAAGTVRLPRLAGVRKAAEMCAFGEPLSAKSALDAGIVDRVVDGDLLESALAFARTASGPRRTRDLPITPDPTAIAELRTRCKKHLEAPLAAIEAIEKASALSFEDGCRAEAEIFRRLMQSDQCKSLIYAFFAERAVAKVPGIDKDTPIFPIREAGVIGAGTMGGGIAMALANAGLRVRLKDTEQAAVDRGLAAIRKNYERSVKSGRTTAEAVTERMSRITPQVNYAGFDSVDIIIEAVFESLTLKKQVFSEIDTIAKPDCILASNTSTLDLDEIAAVTTRPHMVIGTHFFSPANVMRLLEIVRGRETAKPVIATAMALAKSIKKVGVVVGNGFGFVGNRLVIPYMNEAQFLVEEGATPEQVDRVLTEFGMAMGPFAVADLSGLDVFWRIRQEKPRVPGARETLGLPKLYELGRYGQKTGAGWFHYGDDRKAKPDPEVVELVHRIACESGIAQRNITDAEILDRCIFALVNEGAKVLEECVASRAVDIDVIYLTGYGFPAHRGGPMFYADTVGLPHVLARVREFGWTPAALLEQLKPFHS